MGRSGENMQKYESFPNLSNFITWERGKIEVRAAAKKNLKNPGFASYIAAVSRTGLITGWGYTEETKKNTDGPKTASILREAEIFVMPQVNVKKTEGKRGREIERERKKGRIKVKDKKAEEGRTQDRIYTQRS